MRRIALLVTPLVMLAGCAGPAADQADTAPQTSESRGPAAEPTAAESKESDDPGVLTVENNPELAALLDGPAAGDTVNAFSKKYGGQVAEFDGFVADVYINPREHNGASTIDVMAGNAADPTHTGPVFRLSWYAHESPLEDFAKGDGVRVKATLGSIYGYEPYQYFLVAEEGEPGLTRR
jgi:hypothetical protein